MAQQKKSKPLTTDDIEKLEKMGRERGKKFKSLSSHVNNSSLPDSITTGLPSSLFYDHLDHCAIGLCFPEETEP